MSHYDTRAQRQRKQDERRHSLAKNYAYISFVSDAKPQRNTQQPKNQSRTS